MIIPIISSRSGRRYVPHCHHCGAEWPNSPTNARAWTKINDYLMGKAPFIWTSAQMLAGFWLVMSLLIWASERGEYGIFKGETFAQALHDQARWIGAAMRQLW